MRLLLTFSVFLGAAPMAHAQDADVLIGSLTANVRCSAGAVDDLNSNLAKLEAANEAVAAALVRIAADEGRCQGLRDAARDLSVEFFVAPPLSEEDLAASASRAIVDQALDDAARRAASLKFDVGPPPRNVTRGRDINP